MSILNPFTEVDFISLSDHPLKWRWTNPNWNLLTASELAQIRPLTATTTSQVYRSVLPLLGGTSMLSGELFEGVEELSTSGDPQDVSKWLREHVPPSVHELIVIWVGSNVPAIVSSAEIFGRYWDDFCYPSSDDVIAWSSNDEWAAVYHHEERLTVGRRRLAPPTNFLGG